MADSARNYTDEELKMMEKYLSGIYAQAEKDLKKKFEKYMADFVRLEEGHKKDVAEGKWTQEQYETWRKNKLLYGMHWPKLIEQVQREMVKCNETALKYVNGRIADIFAVNYNQLAEVINDSPVGGYSFELINADTVKNIATSDDIMLPPPRKKLNIPKDERWNAKLVNAQLLQGILQGESIPKMAARMANVCNSNKAAATRTARTMTTAAENSGRQSGINRATADGIILIKEWLATNDERTRDSHAEINHQRVRCDAGNTKKVKFSNGLEFPGDWNGEPSEVYNCRCTLITKYAGVDEKLLKKAVKKQVEENRIAKQSATSKEYGAKWPWQRQKNGYAGNENESVKSDNNTTTDFTSQTVEKPSVTDELYDKLISKMNRTINYNPVEYYSTQPTEEEIIKNLMGGDETIGSCASLSLAYIGQKLGLKVLDFRGGTSCQFFRNPKNISKIAKFPGIVSVYAEGKNEVDIGKALLKKCEVGKEYVLFVGRHATVIKKNKVGIISYLELQNPDEKMCGWKKLDSELLEYRFDAYPYGITGSADENFMINITDSDFDDRFKYLLGFINTPEEKQRKGKNGKEK